MEGVGICQQNEEKKGRGSEKVCSEFGGWDISILKRGGHTDPFLE
jgi:hypothetical protein